MSGIEVAGLVLGAVPALIEAIDIYKNGVDKIKSGFKKRKVVEKLGRALREQKSIIEAITQNVLVQSGCEHASEASHAQLRILLQDKQIQEMVDDFLGMDNAQVFSDALVDCMASVSRATIGLASFISELTPVKNNVDIQAILNANAASEKGRLQLFARLSVVFNLKTLEQEIEALDRSTSSLDKFARNVTATHSPSQHSPSRKAVKLAKALRVVRQHAVSLHSALTRQWVTPCHQRHELKVFLDDRIMESKLKQATNSVTASCFKVIFVGVTQPTDFWHETLFHIEPEDPQISVIALPPQGPRVTFSTPQQQSITTRLNVPDICDSISSAASKAHHPIFYLAGGSDIAMTLHTKASATSQGGLLPSVSLQEIFQGRHRRNSSPSLLPWKWRMVLALKIASSFLQFMQTPWVRPSWSASKVHIPYTASSCEFDLSRPFLSAEFSRNASTPCNRQADVMEDLLELGILLLEIWHENEFETHFSQQLCAGNTSFVRRACALEWLNDRQNPLPDLYFHAATHCISGLMTSDPRAMEWDHLELWKCVCENIIVPLSKIA